MQIDWSTLALQTINVLILVWLLSRFLFRPLQTIIAQRQARVDSVLAEAIASRKQAAEAVTSAQSERADIERRREQLLATAQADAEKERTRLLDAAAKEVAALRIDAQSAIARERTAMEEALIARIEDLAVEITRRLLSRISPDAGLDGFVAGLCAQFDTLSPQTQAAFVSGPGQEAIEIVTAAPLSMETQARVRQAFERVIGTGRSFVFHADSALIAGVEVHGRTASLRNSLRNDLDRIAKELRIADEPTG